MTTDVRHLTESQAERMIQTDPEIGSAFWTMALSDLHAIVAAPATHPSLRRKAITIAGAREGK